MASPSTNNPQKKRNGCLRQTRFSEQQQEEIDRTISLVLFLCFAYFLCYVMNVCVGGAVCQQKLKGEEGESGPSEA